MSERPIIFNGEMVRAILDGRKTQTRRVIKPQPEYNGTWIASMQDFACIVDEYPPSALLWEFCKGHHGWLEADTFGPFQPPLSLWVRESFCVVQDQLYYRADSSAADLAEEKRIRREFRADEWPEARWKPSIHMPRCRSRITLEVIDVRVERLQAITAADAIAEGVTFPRCGCEVCSRTSALCTADQGVAIETFRELWQSINAKRGYGWDANPFVWVIEFRRAP